MLGTETGRRKSARISALEKEKKNKASTKSSDNIITENRTYVRRARARKRKRLEDVGQISLQDGEDPKDEDYSIFDDEAAYLSYIQEEPETCILEFILDTLQRRDTHNIFTEPVDPQEVWTYYDIIKEPMDFSTMRAKLQEGYYTSLEQFEYDVNLISTNAMHFNSSITVFYKEALVIQELAQQLFQSLRADPENFQLQFLPSRKDSSRKPRNDGRDVHTRRSYTRRKSQAGTSDANSFGMGNSENSNLFETERRQTYTLSNEDQSLLTIVCDAAKILLHVDNGDLGYEQGLMQFVRNLGPTAQTVGEIKLPQVEALSSHPYTTPSVEMQNCMGPAVLALPAPEVPRHLLGDNNVQMNCRYNLPNSYSNASNARGDAFAQGYARTSSVGVLINDSASNRNMNPPSTSQLSIVPNYRDKGKMVVDLNQNTELQERILDQNQNSKVRLESHIRVVRDFSSPDTSSSGIKFRAVDMLGKPNPLKNQQQLQQAQFPSSTGIFNAGILAWAVNMLANTSCHKNQQPQPVQFSSTGSSNHASLREIMAGRTTYLKPSSSSSSSSLRSSSAKLSSLSEASTSWHDSCSKLNINSAANSAQTGQQVQWGQPSIDQDIQQSCSFLQMLGEDSYPLEKSTFMCKELVDEGIHQLGKSTFLSKELNVDEGNYLLGNTTSMRKYQQQIGGNFQHGSNTFMRNEQPLHEGNVQQDNSAFFSREQQPDGANILSGNGTFWRNEQQLNEAKFHLGDSTFMRADPLYNGNFPLGDSTVSRTEQQIDTGKFPLGSRTLASKEQPFDEGSFKLGNSTFMSKGQQPDESCSQLGRTTFMRTEQQLNEVNSLLWNTTFMSKEQQLEDSNYQLGNSTFASKEQQLDEGNHQYLGTLQQSVDQGVMPEWYHAISTTNEAASTSVQWYPKEPISQSFMSLLMVDDQQPNLALQL